MGTPSPLERISTFASEISPNQRRPRLRALTVLVLLTISTGCATNHLSKFYVDTTEGAPVPRELKKIVPRAYLAEDLKGEVTRLVEEEGYTVLGYSEYATSQPPTIKDLQRKGKEVGATRVICQIHYRETVTQYRPVYNYVPGTTATYNGSGTAIANSRATAYGDAWTGYGTSQATGSYSSSASTSTPDRYEYAGTTAYNVRLYDVGAVFCRRPAVSTTTTPPRVSSSE